ncbi:type VI secretion-associated protein, ImpA family [Luteitalea pratensis]|uniref:Type VI secretion-associated protein, ImpA family n=1 Tax=Luteitalea pratensis TaxID=1855912 RepID=A0A143PHI8_LUTPR|nr:type VI secretion system ImpA family N-terminal domain-containing protein [Luteitalea pratensis]AMY07713.1 type VI secretion-associated protein, ImpA family [Luteitalea pratensis]
MQLPDLDALLVPVSADEPCGPNLEYAPLFAELEAAIAGRPERQFGNFIEPAQGPDWARVQELAAKLLSQTKDLRVAIAWTRALTVTHGLDGAAAGLQLIARLLTTWPRDVYPVVEPDEDRPPLRWFVLANLAAPRGLLHDLHGTKSGAEASIGAEWARIDEALITIREVLWDTAPGNALPELWSSIGVDGAVDSGAMRPWPEGEPVAADATVWSKDQQGLLESICDLIERAGFDAASVCRRAHRISVSRYLDLAADVAPPSREHAASSRQPRGSDQARRSDGRGQS